MDRSFDLFVSFFYEHRAGTTLDLGAPKAIAVLVRRNDRWRVGRGESCR
jgi:hypothetical protein